MTKIVFLIIRDCSHLYQMILKAHKAYQKAVTSTREYFQASGRIFFGVMLLLLFPLLLILMIIGDQLSKPSVDLML
jgi:hypothetical protein